MAAAREAVEKAVISLAYRQNTAGDPRALRMWDVQLRHVVDTAFEREDETAATLSTNFGYYLRMSGDLAGARPYYERALAIRERVLGPEHPDSTPPRRGASTTWATCCKRRATWPGRGRTTSAPWPSASASSARSTPTRRRASTTWATCCKRRATWPGRGRTSSAPWPSASASSARSTPPRREPQQPGRAAASAGRPGRGAAGLRARPGHRERVLGPEHPDTAASLNNLGYLLQAQGDLAGARPYYERALAIRERVLGPEHPDTAGSLNNLGYLLQAQGDLAGARPYYERALAIRERVLGPEHPDTAGSLNNLGYLLQAQGDLAGARPYYERALAVLTTRLGPDHPNTRIVRDNLAALPPRIEHG